MVDLKIRGGGMFVQHILNTKNNANLITVPVKTDLSEAISILVAHDWCGYRFRNGEKRARYPL